MTSPHSLSGRAGRYASAIGVTFALLACNAPVPPHPTGGTDTNGGPCGRGLVVVSSDYQSTNVSLLAPSGEVVSESFLSSASESAALSAPLSGDVVVPTSPQNADELVLIDRFPAAVLTWVEVTSATVRAQLDVSTGFAANPRDVVTVDDGRAFVTRFETNPDPDRQAFDRGGDVLVIDTTVPEIVDRIDLSAAVPPDFQPRPSRMRRVGDRVYVSLLAYNADFTDALPSRIVAIDVPTHSIAETLTLTGLYGCDGLDLSADGRKLAVSCTGQLAGGATTNANGAGIAVVDLQSFTVERNHLAMDGSGAPYGFSVAFLEEGSLLTTTLGSLPAQGNDAIPDTLVRIDEDGAITTLLTSTEPFVLGDIRCGLATSTDTCGACFLADAEEAVVRRLNAGSGEQEAAIRIDDGIGLPPRGLGGF